MTFLVRDINGQRNRRISHCQTMHSTYAKMHERVRIKQNNGNSGNKHFEIILAFDYILVIIRNDASYITVILI